jgi:hypothetical protein
MLPDSESVLGYQPGALKYRINRLTTYAAKNNSNARRHPRPLAIELHEMDHHQARLESGDQ